MSFNSIDYLFFFPIVVLLYFVIPTKIRMYWLLVVSYYFYMSWNAKYGLLLLVSTAVTYLCGLVMEWIKRNAPDNRRKLLKQIVVFFGLIINMGLLFYFKYMNFAIDNLNAILLRSGANIQYPNRDIVLPVGISFFIFQAVGYMIDVYREEIDAEKNPVRYALFVSFFPQLVAGPIERSKNLLNQLREDRQFDVDNVKNGLLIMAYGLFMKVVVADNIAAVINPVFETPDNYNGMMIVFAVMLFAFQIYCDFNGYTQIAIGSARVLGYKLNQNFNAPYLGMSVKDYWKRWHISMTSWFRDYLYIPLGGSRKGKIRKHINTMIVFLCSGLWHGAAWHYVVWGGINGVFVTAEDIFAPVKKSIEQKLAINNNLFMYKIFRRVLAFALVNFTLLFFRADDLGRAFHMLKMMIRDFKPEWFLGFEFVGAFNSEYTLMTVVISLLIVVVIDVLIYKRIDVKKIVFKQQIIFRWMIYSIIMLVIMYWGLYGTEYEQTQFIYFQF